MNNIFNDSIIASASVIEDYFFKNKSLNTTPNPIAITNEKIHKSGWAEGAGLRTGLINIVEQRIGKSIEISLFSNQSDINGTCIEFENSTIIFINSKLNFCQRRFIAAKELNHLLVNKNNKALRINTSTTDEFNSILSFLASNGDADTDQKLSERMTYYGAMELLFPKQYFESISNKNNKTIAEQLKIPTQIVEIRKNIDTSNDFSTVYETSNFSHAKLRDIVDRAT